jgi:kynurenine formamidase
MMFKNIKHGFCLLFLCFIPFSVVHSKSNIIDLTYPYNEKTIYWPTEKGFNLKKVFYGDTPNGYFYSAFKFCAPEHGGTHLDAPRHFSKHGNTVDQIPVSQLIGNAVVIDVEKKVARNRDYEITKDDIKSFEIKHGALNSQDIVLFYTGWGKYWGNKKSYLGSNAFNDVYHLHFPGISKKAALYLVSKKVKGIGLDTPSLDHGPSRQFWAHRIILGANIYGLENIAHLNNLPPRGARLIVAPMKIQGGSGAPTRIFALF